MRFHEVSIWHHCSPGIHVFVLVILCSAVARIAVFQTAKLVERIVQIPEGFSYLFFSSYILRNYISLIQLYYVLKKSNSLNTYIFIFVEISCWPW